jgi:hypothetical protein
VVGWRSSVAGGGVWQIDEAGAALVFLLWMRPVASKTTKPGDAKVGEITGRPSVSSLP